MIATGYSSHKILGLSLAKTRSETDLRRVFDEADRNTQFPIEIITADAWSGTQAMALNLLRPLILIIHKHKAPYDKVVIWKIEYQGQERFIMKLGAKCDLFLKRARREIHYLETHESLVPKPSKKRGRPKGKRKPRDHRQKKSSRKKKRGRKGLFTVFDKGKRGYVKIDPTRKSVRVGSTVPIVVTTTLRQIIDLFSGKSISNNLAENINSVIQAHLCFSGPKTPISCEQRIRAFVKLRNNPELLQKLSIPHRFHGQRLQINLERSYFLPLFITSQKRGSKEKKEMILN